MKKGFTLVELLVVLTVIAVLVTISVFGLQGARESARDSRRKSDLETIRSGLEIYRADCDAYPSSITFGGSLRGTVANPSAACSTSNTYIAEIPQDPQDPSRAYRYARTSTITYELCAALEQGSGSVSCGGSSSCGSKTCNYKVVSP